MSTPPKPGRDIGVLLALMAALRTPKTGCPWDLEQSFETIAPYTIEEAYEVADAIQRGDFAGLREELGDLLLQVVFHARMAEEAEKFDFGDVVHAITEKLVRRHPHVFGDARELSPDEVKALWSKIKTGERRGESERRTLDGIPLALPALTRALKLQGKAANVGFDWEKKSDVEAKVAEELGELAAAANQAAAHEEIGDLLFALVNLARWLDVDPEGALRDANAKFVRRFDAIEGALKARGKTPTQSDLAEMDTLWNEEKKTER